MRTTHPAIEHSLRALDALMRGPFGRHLSPQQARDIITVEMTHEGYSDLMMNMDRHTLNATYGNLRGREGPLRINGIRFYVVDRLRDGDTWRVLNALGTN